MKKLLLTVRMISLVLSLLLLGAIFASYLLRPDRAAAVTILPPAFWFIPGAVLAGLARGRLGRISALLWVVFLLAFMEPLSLVRGLRAPGKGTVRVVTFNAAGEREALTPIANLHPDIVLLQEAPGRRSVEELARKLFGAHAGVARGVEGAVLCRGKLQKVHSHLRTAIRARVTLASGVEVEVVGVHLMAVQPSLKLWSRQTWEEATENRKRRREQMQALAQDLRAIPAGRPVILGGDFNAPAGDAIFREIQPRLREAFREAGRGWGGTWMSDLPLTRIDQVWISRGWQAVNLQARKAPPSDHRMVVCDLTERRIESLRD